jgi:hypothetical protein
MVWACTDVPLHAQTDIPLHVQGVQYTKPIVWFGGAVGANFNFFRGTTQVLNNDFTTPEAFHDGNGAGLFAASLLEIQHPDTRLGFRLQAGYDSRRGSFDSQTSVPCNCITDLSTHISYLTIEPSLRIAPFKSNFYLYTGPRIAHNLTRSFTYQEGVNPDFPNELPAPNITGSFSDVNRTVLTWQFGAGYDIPISSQNQRTQLVLSPFIAYHPDFLEDTRSTETWGINTLRAGAALKIGFGREILSEVIVEDYNVLFSVYAPRSIPSERTVREVFPIRNYVFFNSGSTEIPTRYVSLSDKQVKEFKEDQLGVYVTEPSSGRSTRQISAYYNVINILGDRMGRYPESTITLVGSSEKGQEDGRAMAESIKRYLRDIFSIDASRIKVEGLDKPKIGTEKPGGSVDLDRMREDARRVSIESNSPGLLMELEHGPGAPLRPLEITALQTAPLDSYITFNSKGAKEAFSSWSLEVMDEKGKVQYFGPYTQERISIPGRTILGTRPEADYKVTMVGLLKTGKTVRQTTPVHVVLRTPSKDSEAMRFSILYEFDESTAIPIYQKYIFRGRDT